MKLLIVAFVTLLAGCQASHKLPPFPGKANLLNSAEVMQRVDLNFG